MQYGKSESEKSSEKIRKYYNRGAKNRILSEAEQVLVLLPIASNKLHMQWKVPYTIV